MKYEVAINNIAISGDLTFASHNLFDDAIRCYVVFKGQEINGLPSRVLQKAILRTKVWKSLDAETQERMRRNGLPCFITGKLTNYPWKHPNALEEDYEIVILVRNLQTLEDPDENEVPQDQRDNPVGEDQPARTAHL